MNPGLGACSHRAFEQCNLLALRRRLASQPVLGSRGKGGQGAHHCSKHDLLIARHGTHLLEPLAGQLQGGKQEAGRQRVRQGGTQPADGRGSSEGAVLSCQSRPSMPGWGTPGQDLSTSLRHRTRRPCSLGMLQRSCVQINVPGRICTCGASGVSLISGANSLYMMSGVMSRPARAGTTEACEVRARTGGRARGQGLGAHDRGEAKAYARQSAS